MTAEVGADEASIPGPLVLGVRGRMDARVAAAAPDESLEGCLLGRLEHVARREQEHDRAVAPQVRVREVSRVLCGIDGDPALLPKVAKCPHGVWDRVVPEAGGLREEQHARLRQGLGGSRVRERGEREAGHDGHGNRCAEHDQLFTTRTRTPIDLHRWRARHWTPALRASGLEHRGPYAMRHTFASWTIAAGLPTFEIAATMGTSLEQLSKTYAHLLPDSADRARQALDAFLAEPGEAFGDFAGTRG